jgi:hypothetical protein
MKITTAISTMLVATFVWTAANGSAQTFADGTFNNSDWTVIKIYDNTVGLDATFTAGQSASGGNLDAYQLTTHDYAQGGLLVAHLNNGASYTPATQGAITSISFSYDLNSFANGASLAIAYSGLLDQGGTYYYPSPLNLISVNAWVSYAQNGLTALDFTALDGSTHPDFSDLGAAMQFGFVTANGTAGGATHTASGIDNWAVTITEVPEPATYELWFGVLLGWCGWQKWRGQRQAPRFFNFRW